ncbi:MAG: type I restriction endonuclease subunit R, partial [candidate division KSB1 bacterium]|nr:type I restriction endonuclease subunit R [candidate division KSB1 bacterium]
VLQARFAKLMEQGRAEYLTAESTENTEKIFADSAPSVVNNDKLAEAVLERFRDKDRRETFYRFFRELEELYEILSPDPFLRPYLENYQRLLEMYRLLRAAYEPHVPVDKSFLRKTAEIVQKHTRGGVVREPQATYQLGPNALLALVREEKPETVKVFNLLKELHRLVEEQGHTAPYLFSIGERAEEIRRRFEERQIEAQEALVELEQLVCEYAEAENERCNRVGEGAGRPYAPQAFAVEWWLRARKVDPQQALQVAQTIEIAFAEFPHWMTNRKQEGGLRSRLYKSLLDIGITEVVAWADAILNLLRRAAE